jgi:hypothetical protein
MNLFSRLFRKRPIAKAVEASKIVPRTAADLGPVEITPPDFAGLPKNPLDGLPTINDFPTVEKFAESKTVQTKDGKVFVGDAASHPVITQDGTYQGSGTPSVNVAWSAYTVPEAVGNWYNAQSFIGYQTCGLMQQHWLVDKACRMPGEDATRNGYELSVMNDDDPNFEGLGVDIETFIARVRELDKDYKIAEHMREMWRFTQVFGIRVCIFQVESQDPDYYAKPFNIDGVTKGSYKGIKQVDPYWMMPVFGEGFSDPTSQNFYVPEYWTIGGKKYHKSHLVIGKGPEPMDILKPMYIFGGIPLTQRIYERVYNAERTANEGPLLATSKRQTVLHTDLMAAEAHPQRFLNRIMKWVSHRDNFGVKTVGLEDAVEQFDTSLADLDSVIMNQYQLVAAIAEVPATKLLGTSPKGFQSNGSGEEKNYHEKLESVQAFLTPLLQRHHQLVVKSEYGVDIQLEAVWNRTDSFTAAELADLNLKKAQTGEILLNLGATSPDDERNRVKNDPLSGYNHLGDEEASSDMGASPENEAKLQTAESKEQTAQAKETEVGAPSDAIAMKPDLDRLAASLQPHMENDDLDAGLMDRLRQFHAMVTGSGADNLDCEDIRPILEALAKMLNAPSIMDAITVKRRAMEPTVTRSVLPSVNPAMRTEVNTGARTLLGDAAVAGRGYSETGLPDSGMGAKYSHRNMPKVKMGRMTISIENRKGTVRSGETLEGKAWSTLMPHHYGYINGVEGADGDELDAFVGPNTKSRLVVVINQVEPTNREFDEHKVMFGFNSEEEALEAYAMSYQKDWDGYDSHVVFQDLESFREWMRSADLSAPCSDYRTFE